MNYTTDQKKAISTHETHQPNQLTPIAHFGWPARRTHPRYGKAA